MKHCKHCKDLFEEESVGKSAPWYSFYHRVREFFDGDPDFEVSEIDEDLIYFDITVHNRKKCEILRKVFTIPKYANKLTVDIMCDEEERTDVSEEDMAYLLEGNKYFSRYYDGYDYIAETNDLIPIGMKYLMMAPIVVQYYDDIYNNPYGLDTKTAEAVAKEMFKKSHCNITTDCK